MAAQFNNKCRNAHGSAVQTEDTVKILRKCYTSADMESLLSDISAAHEDVVFYYEEDKIHIVGYPSRVERGKRDLESRIEQIKRNNPIRSQQGETRTDVISTKENSQTQTTPLDGARQNFQKVFNFAGQVNQPKLGRSFKTSTGERIHVFAGDITKLSVGAVVNAANTRLQHGGGVAGAISKAAGPQLQTNCNKYMHGREELDVGEVYTSAAYKMPSQYIIHVAGPRWKENKDKTVLIACLHGCFLSCLAEADGRGFTSVAIPAVGSGIYGTPLSAVALQMCQATLDFIHGCNGAAKIRDILLVDINEEVVKVILDLFSQRARKGKLECIDSDFLRFHEANAFEYSTPPQPVAQGPAVSIYDPQTKDNCEAMQEGRAVGMSVFYDTHGKDKQLKDAESGSKVGKQRRLKQN